MLEIRLLGGLTISWEGAALPALGSSRAESLLAYLLLHPAPQPRPHLAFVLWPDSTEGQALTNLRHQLHLLRRGLPTPDRFLEATRRTLRWNFDSPFRTDVAALQEMAGRHDASLPALREVVESYRGDLLEGSYDEWVLPHRDRLRRLQLGLLARCAGLAAEQGQLPLAIHAAEELIRLDPVNEEPYRLLMDLHRRRDDQAAALNTYHACVEVLERELGVEPSPATRHRYEELLQVHGGVRLPAPGSQPALVGRDEERGQLIAAWRAAAERSPQLALVTGESGIGKSRLVKELATWAAAAGATAAVAQAYPAEGLLPFGLVTAWLRSPSLSGLTEVAGPADRLEIARLLPELRQEPLGPEVQSASDADQLRLYSAVARLLLGSRSPLLLIAEDLHWADRRSLRFLHFLLRQQSDQTVLVAATARREELDPDHPVVGLVSSLRAMGRLTEVELKRLTREQTAELAGLIAGRSLEPAAADRVHAESEGNPLFVVETMRAGPNEGERTLSPRIQGVIELRLSRLSAPALRLLEVAATVGRRFSTDLICYAAGAGRGELVGVLDELWRRRILREQGSWGYDFTHDKIREVVFAAMSPALRMHNHLRVAEALEGSGAEGVASPGSLIALHYDRAGAPERAIEWYERAASEALLAYAGDEAVRLLERGLELLAGLPATPARNSRELSLLLALIPPLALAQGAASQRVQEVERRAQWLAGDLGVEAPAPLLRAAALTRLSLGDFDEAGRLGELLGRRGARSDDAVMKVESHYLLGISAFWRGHLLEARSHFERAVELYRDDQHTIHRIHYGLDPKVICLSRLGITCWFLGHPSTAGRITQEALAQAAALGHAPSLATALVFACYLAMEQGDRSAFRSWVAELSNPSVYGGSRATSVGSASLSGLAEVRAGRPEIGTATIMRALEEGRVQRHAPGIIATILRVLLEAQWETGDPGGLATAAQALEFPDGVRLWESTTRHIRARMLDRAGGSPDDVDRELGRAIASARRQSAWLPLLRAATTRLEHRLRRGGDAVEAAELVRLALGRLAERDGSPDVSRADVVLAHL